MLKTFNIFRSDLVRPQIHQLNASLAERSLAPMVCTSVGASHSPRRWLHCRIVARASHNAGVMRCADALADFPPASPAGPLPPSQQADRSGLLGFLLPLLDIFDRWIRDRYDFPFFRKHLNSVRRPKYRRHRGRIAEIRLQKKREGDFPFCRLPLV